jgi:RNA polymerase sigma factor (sigma-70 family)
MSEAAAPLSDGHVPVAGLRLLGDDRLARRAAAGDRQAFAVLYQRHHQALFRYCRAILGNAEDAADALQNTMAAALRALAGEQREIRVKPWLYRIAHNESVSLLRQRPSHAGLEQAVNVAAPRGPDAATKERLRELVSDLHELQDRQRAALVMRELSGLDYAEIAAALDASPAATKQLVFEARTALHEMAEGREMSCDSVRRVLSEADRRKLRGRKVRAHMKACAGCRDFHKMMSVRRRDLAALAPPLPATAAAALLSAFLGGGHGGGSGGLAALAGGTAAKAAATSAVAKSVAAIAVVATVGAGTAAVTGNLPDVRGDEAPPAGASQDAVVAPPEDVPRGASSRGKSEDRAEAKAKRRRKDRKARSGDLRPSVRDRGPGSRRRPAARPGRPPKPAAAQQRPRPRPPVRPVPGGGRPETAPTKPALTVPLPPERPVPPARVPDPAELP